MLLIFLAIPMQSSGKQQQQIAAIAKRVPLLAGSSELRSDGNSSGDACVASLQSMLTGIQSMQVGATSSAQQPSAA